MGTGDDFGRWLLRAASERWYSRTGLVAAIAAVVAFGVILSSGIAFSAIEPLEWALIGFAIAAVCGVWFVTRIPRARRGRVGFGVAIEFETPEHEKQIRADLIVALRDLLNGSHLRHQFQFIEFSQAVAKRVTDDAIARWLLRKAHAHFLIYGRARLRGSGAEQSHVLDLKWAVRHTPISPEHSVQFAREANQVFPKRMILGADGHMIVCEAAARHVDAVARYVIGTAAAISGDLQYAEQLLLDAEAKLVRYVETTKGAAPLTMLLGRVRSRISELYVHWISLAHRNYLRSRDRHELIRAEGFVSKLRLYDPDNYSARLEAAICAFVLRRDIAGARREIEACRGNADATWRYSEAFLNAYEGDLDGAYRTYQRAIVAATNDASTLNQVEEFIQRVIDEESDRGYLYYCLGYLNYRAKGDLEAAEADLTRFVEQADATRFAKHIGIARRWLEEIDAGRGIANPLPRPQADA